MRDLTEGTWHVSGVTTGWRWQDVPGRVFRAAESVGVDVSFKEDRKSLLVRTVSYDAVADTRRQLERFADIVREAD